MENEPAVNDSFEQHGQALTNTNPRTGRCEGFFHFKDNTMSNKDILPRR